MPQNEHRVRDGPENTKRGLFVYLLVFLLTGLFVHMRLALGALPEECEQVRADQFLLQG